MRCDIHETINKQLTPFVCIVFVFSLFFENFCFQWKKKAPIVKKMSKVYVSLLFFSFFSFFASFFIFWLFALLSVERIDLNLCSYQFATGSQFLFNGNHFGSVFSRFSSLCLSLCFSFSRSSPSSLQLRNQVNAF